LRLVRGAQPGARATAIDVADFGPVFGAAAVIAAAATVALGVVYPDQRRPITRERREVVPE
jgi:hypothetical protein